MEKMKHLSVRHAPNKRRVRTPPPISRGTGRGIPSGSRFTPCPVCEKSVATSLLDSHIHTCMAYIESEQAIDGRLSQEGPKAEEAETEAVSHKKSGSEQGECQHDSATLTCANTGKKESQHESPSHENAGRIAVTSSSRCNEQQEWKTVSGLTHPIRQIDSESGDANSVIATIPSTRAEISELPAVSLPLSSLFTARACKVVHLVRHGHTSSSHLGGSEFDLRLTPLGLQQILVSPLTRALQTLTQAMGDWCEAPVEVTALHAEHVATSGDVGRPPEVVSPEFPHFDFSALPPIWWFSPKEAPNVGRKGESLSREPLGTLLCQRTRQ